MAIDISMLAVKMYTVASWQVGARRGSDLADPLVRLGPVVVPVQWS